MRPQIDSIIRLLLKGYPEAKTSLRFHDPLNLLVATILSAQCTDKTVNRVTPFLFKKYKSANAYARADLRMLMREVRSIGLYRSKAKNIKKMGQVIGREFSGKVPDSIDKLVTLPGVGRKTANIVLSNAFGKDEGIAVDTHVKRLSKRLGLTANETPTKIESDLMNIVPKKHWGLFNHLLVSHGRAVCRARNPLHGICCIRPYCKWYSKNKRRQK
ncbi:MAG: endonuclease III [Candidatus Omnitrophota bacterium]